MIDHTVGRILDLFDVDVGVAHRRGELAPGFEDNESWPTNTKRFL
jgi:hypothetical protein